MDVLQIHKPLNTDDALLIKWIRLWNYGYRITFLIGTSYWNFAADFTLTEFSIFRLYQVLAGEILDCVSMINMCLFDQKQIQILSRKGVQAPNVSASTHTREWHPMKWGRSVDRQETRREPRNRRDLSLKIVITPENTYPAAVRVRYILAEQKLLHEAEENRGFIEGRLGLTVSIWL